MYLGSISLVKTPPKKPKTFPPALFNKYEPTFEVAYQRKIASPSSSDQQYYYSNLQTVRYDTMSSSKYHIAHFHWPQEKI